MHIALLRRLVVDKHRWLTADDVEDAIAACNLLPGPASTQLAVYCAWRVRGRAGALAGGLAFILPGLCLILALSVLFLASSPPLWVVGAGAGAGSAVAAVAVAAGEDLVRASRRRAGNRSRRRWALYALAGGAAAATAGPWLVLVLISCGLVELLIRHATGIGARLGGVSPLPLVVAATSAAGGTLSLVWVALKVGALSYGGGFVIIPLMQSDAVDRYEWMTDGQFLSAVALGQVTPGPVTHTVAAVGYAAAGIGGGLLAALVAFAPSFAFVVGGGRRFDALRSNRIARMFLDGAGPAAVGAILGSAVPLTRSLSQPWQYGTLGGAAVLLLLLRRGVVPTLLLAGVVGVVAALAGAPLPR